MLADFQRSDLVFGGGNVVVKRALFETMRYVCVALEFCNLTKLIVFFFLRFCFGFLDCFNDEARRARFSVGEAKSGAFFTAVLAMYLAI